MAPSLVQNRGPMLITTMTVLALAGGQPAVQGQGESKKGPESSRPARGPVALTLGVGTVSSTESSNRTLRGQRIGARAGLRLAPGLALEGEGLATVGLLPDLHGYSGWGVRTFDQGSVSPGESTAPLFVRFPTVAAAGVGMVGRLGRGGLSLMGPRTQPVEVLGRAGVRAVWSREIHDSGGRAILQEVRLHPAVVLGLELRVPLAARLDVSVASGLQLAPVPWGQEVRLTRSAGLTLGLTWHAGSAADSGS